MTLGRLKIGLNPVLARESRVRMRGWKAPALISLYVALLGAVVLLVLSTYARASRQTFAPEIGMVIFFVLVFAQFGLLVFSAPGLTASAISGERERQTLDLLLVTRMTPLQVVVGKLGAAVGFTLLLMISSLPVYSILFFFGGVSPYRLMLTAIIYVVTVLFLGAIGISFSALFRRTQAAVVAAYGTTFALIIVPLIATILLFEVFYDGGAVPPGWTVILGYMNPAIGLAAAAGPPISEVTELYRDVLNTPELREAMWWKYCLFALTMTVGLLWWTAVRIQPLKHK